MKPPIIRATRRKLLGTPPHHTFTRTVASAALGLLALFAGSASAVPVTPHQSIIGFESFDQNGSIEGQTGGVHWDYNQITRAYTGFVSDWDVLFGTVNVVDGGLVTGDGGTSAAKREFNGTLEGAGGSDTDSEERSGAVRASGVVFIGFDINRSSTAIWSGLSAYEFGDERLFFGVTGGGSELDLVSIEISGVGSTNSHIALPDGTTNRLVAVIDYDNDKLGIFVNPTRSDTWDATGGTADVTMPYTGTAWTTALRLASQGVVVWDNLRAANTLIDAVLVRPTAYNLGAAAVTYTSATLHGAEVTPDDAPFTERGFVYSPTDTDPNIGDADVTRVVVSGTTSEFSTDLTGLVPNAIYTFKAYAISAQGTHYSRTRSFKATESFAMDDFADPATSGIGWADNWSSPTIPVTGLSFPGIANSGNAANGSGQMFRTLSTPQTSGFVYVSALIKGGNGYCNFSLYQDNSEKIGFGVIWTGRAPSSQFGALNFDADPQRSYSTVNVDASTHFVLARLDLDANTASMWVDPDLSVPLGAPAFTRSGASFDFNSIRLEITGNSVIDELSVSTSSPSALPIVVTPTVASLTDDSATLGGVVLNDKNFDITRNGIVYAETATNAAPVVGGPGTTAIDDSTPGLGAFSLPVTGLTPSTGYSYRAFATNRAGTSYSSLATFTTLAPPPVGQFSVTYPTGESLTGAAAGTKVNRVRELPDVNGNDAVLSRIALSSGVLLDAFVREGAVVLKAGDTLAGTGDAQIAKLYAMSYGVFLAELKLGTGSPAVTLATNKVVCRETESGFELLARSGSPAPGTSSTFRTFAAATGSQDAHVFFKANTIESTASNTGLWALPSGGALTLLVKEGQTLNVGTGAKRVNAVAAFPSGLKSQAEGRVLYGTNAIITRITVGADQAIVVIPASATSIDDWTIVARAGSDAPNGVGKYAMLGLPAAEGDNVAFRATLAPSATVTSANNSIVVGVSQSYEAILAREGDIAPGTTTTFSSFDDPAVGSNNQSSFIAKLSGTTSATDNGLWEVSNGSLALVAREGDPAPALSGGETINSIIRFAHPGGGLGPVFMATLNGATNKTNSVLYGTIDHTPVVLARTGDLFNVAGTIRTLTVIKALKQDLGSEGVARGYNDLEVFVIGSFGATRSALLTLPVELPPVP